MIIIQQNNIIFEKFLLKDNQKANKMFLETIYF